MSKDGLSAAVKDLELVLQRLDIWIDKHQGSVSTFPWSLITQAGTLMTTVFEMLRESLEDDPQN